MTDQTSQNSTPAPSLLLAATVDEALVAMADGARPIAGGTDLVVGARQGKAPLPHTLVAIHQVPELLTVADNGETVRIGAAVSHAALMTEPAVVDRLTAVADAAALIGSPATRHVGTIGGNVMNGSPAMDTGAPLAVLGAAVELRNTERTRTVPVMDLWEGPGRISAGPDELCTAVVVPTPESGSGSAYVRLEYRRAMEIAVVGAAAAVTLAADGTISRLSVALTAVGPTILLVTGLDELIGRVVDDRLLDAIQTAASTQAAPISDLRAGERYRRHTVGVMAKRAMAAAATRAGGQDLAIPVNRATGIGAAQ